jgi:hypothetical protein
MRSIPRSPRVFRYALALTVFCTCAHTHAQDGAATGGPQPQSTQPEKKSEAPKEIETVDIVRAALEPAYLAYPIAISGLDPLIFESNVVAHFMIHRPSWPFALVLSPKILVRMFRAYSAPVKTPSYMPRITAYVWLQRKVNAPTVYASLMLSHHSNGQAQSFFDENGAINRDTGSFSTNYLELSAYATDFGGKWFGWSSLSLEWHPGFNESPELKGRYGLWRMHVASTVLAKLPLQGRLNLSISAILDRFEHTGTSGFMRAVERFPISARYTMAVPGIDLGLYLGYYLGHDYYNIYFDRIIHTVQIGISGSVTPSVIEND